MSRYAFALVSFLAFTGAALAVGRLIPTIHQRNLPFVT
jgi:hypothetical protein